jgi:hypothetical protein
MKPRRGGAPWWAAEEGGVVAEDAEPRFADEGPRGTGARARPVGDGRGSRRWRRRSSAPAAAATPWCAVRSWSWTFPWLTASCGDAWVLIW